MRPVTDEGGFVSLVRLQKASNNLVALDSTKLGWKGVQVVANSRELGAEVQVIQRLESLERIEQREWLRWSGHA